MKNSKLVIKSVGALSLLALFAIGSVQAAPKQQKEPVKKTAPAQQPVKETKKETPVKASPVKATPVKAAPVKAAPEQASPLKK